MLIASNSKFTLRLPKREYFAVLREVIEESRLISISRVMWAAMCSREIGRRRKARPTVIYHLFPDNGFYEDDFMKTDSVFIIPFESLVTGSSCSKEKLSKR